MGTEHHPSVAPGEEHDGAAREIVLAALQTWLRIKVVDITNTAALDGDQSRSSRHVIA
jgi:hypothetical protein